MQIVMTLPLVFRGSLDLPKKQSIRNPALVMLKDVKTILLPTFLLAFLCFTAAQAAEAPRVGREAAARYFERRSPAQDVAPSDHYLALHIGSLLNGTAWDWGMKGRENDTGSMSAGLTYRLDEWNGSMDFDLRVDFNEYKVAGEKPLKMSLMPMILFPDAASRFPLYFGFGAGLGVFFKQIKDESPLAFDYQLVMGARFFNVFENVGFFLETGMKNHLLLSSSGQFNGVFLTAGAVFTF